MIVTTCFHTIHLNCFEKHAKESGLKFSCPLCSKKSNCFFPKHYEKEDKKINLMFKNAMLGYMISEHAELSVENVFTLLMRHVVEVNGLNSVISFTDYELKKKNLRKTNEFVDRFLEGVYTSEDEERNNFNRNFEEFLEEVKTCEKKSYFLVQTILAKALLTKLNCDEFKDIDLVLQLRDVLVRDEFEIIKWNLDEMLGDELLLPPAENEINELQKESFSFKLPPIPQNTFMFSLNASKKCDACSNKKRLRRMCMICGKLLCEDCIDGHSSAHGISFELVFEDGAIQYNSKSTHKYSVVYFNQFQGSYDERYDNEITQWDKYELNDIKVQKMLMELLDES